MNSPNLVFQVHVEDHLSPLVAAFNEALAHGVDTGPMPEDAVHVECRPFRSGGSIRVLPSASLLLWMSRVMAGHQYAYWDKIVARNAATERADVDTSA